MWVGIAATKSTWEAVCTDRVGTPDLPTLRGYFTDQLRGADLAAGEEHRNAALAVEGPRHGRRPSQEVASDYPERP